MVNRFPKLIQKISENQIAIFMVFAAVAIRVIPFLATGKYGNNFAPVAALALFGGTYLKKNQALFLPLVAMMASDLIIGFHNLIFFTWGTYFVIALMGLWLKNNKKVVNIGIAALTSSLLFFFVTNFAVWAFTPLYAKTFDGLVQCYVMALPFLKNTLAGDAFYVAVFFGLYELLSSYLKSLKIKLA